MPAKIRLTRHGKKKSPYYHIIVADSRAPRDGKYIEKIGSYDPNTDPATINIDGDKALDWLRKGAQPTDTARAILSYKGVLLRNHLAKGVTKGALTQEDADKKFNSWLSEKENKIEDKTKKIIKEKEAVDKKRLAAEAEVNEAKEKAIKAKRAALAEEVKTTTETKVEEAPASTPTSIGATADKPAEKTEVKKEEPKAEVPPVEKEEVKQEEPKVDLSAEVPTYDKSPVDKSAKAEIPPVQKEEVKPEEPKPEETPASAPAAILATADKPAEKEDGKEESGSEEVKK